MYAEDDQKAEIKGRLLTLMIIPNATKDVKKK